MVVDVAGEVDVAVVGAVVGGEEAQQVVAGDGVEVLLLGEAAAGVVVAVDGAVEEAAGDDVGALAVHQVLALVVGADDAQPLLGEERFVEHLAHQGERLAGVAFQRVEGEVTVVYGHGEFEPRAVVVEFLGQFGGGVVTGAFAQQPVGEERLQQFVLMPLSGAHHDVQADGVERVRAEDIEMRSHLLQPSAGKGGQAGEVSGLGECSVAGECGEPRAPGAC